jgi:hypothetical protein
VKQDTAMKCFISGEECQHRTTEDPTSVFVISPFGYPFDDIYEKGIKPNVQEITCKEIEVDISGCEDKSINSTLELCRADQAFQLGFIMCQRICKRIQESQFVIADVTKPNPNVFYELGLSYGLNKKIILLGQRNLGDAFTFGLVKDNESYIHYRSLADFEKTDMFINAFKKPIRNTFDMEGLPEAKILNLINEDQSIKGLYHKTLEKAIDELSDHQKICEPTTPGETNTDSPENKGENGKKKKKKKILQNNWEVATRTISFNSKIDEMISDFKDCRICAVDSSFYGLRDSDLNPFLFFCLGLGHGFQKEVVPLTNTPEVKHVLPFDVRGLWHIFFKDLEQLKKQFKGILPEIDRRWSREKKNYLHRRIWDSFLQEEEKLHIMTCARDVGVDEDRGGKRTNIDKWDYTSVSEIAQFIGKNYPNATVNISPPKSKRTRKAIESNKNGVIEDIKTDLADKNCIIIGSPDVSDYAEILLAKLHDIEPYQEERQVFKGYAIIKSRRKVPSSFYWVKDENKKENEGVCILEMDSRKDYVYYQNSSQDDGFEKIYGILTIADNPFVSNGKKRKIMILSGTSGIATYALAKLLTCAKKEYVEELKEMYKIYNTRDRDEADDKKNMTGDKVNKGNKDQEMIKDKPGDLKTVGDNASEDEVKDRGVQVLVGTLFRINRGEEGEGDNRSLEDESEEPGITLGEEPGKELGKKRVFFKDMIRIKPVNSSSIST